MQKKTVEEMECCLGDKELGGGGEGIAEGDAQQPDIKEDFGGNCRPEEVRREQQPFGQWTDHGILSSILDDSGKPKHTRRHTGAHYMKVL